MDILAYWYLFPVAIFISTIAMSAGIGGAVLFSPFMLVVMKLEPVVALASSLCIEMFGFASGLFGYAKAKSINYKVVEKILPLSLFGVIAGVFVGHLVAPFVLEIVLASLLIVLGYKFLFGVTILLSGLRDKKKDYLNQDVRMSSFAGGLLVGMVSSGLGELNEYNFLERMKMSLAEASGTSIMIVALSAFVGVVAHGYFLAQNTVVTMGSIFPILLFAIPGVIIGAQLGVKLAQRLTRYSYAVEKMLGLLFVFLAIVIVMS